MKSACASCDPPVKADSWETRSSGKCDVMRRKTSPVFEIARVFVRFDHVASFHLDELGASDFYLYINPPCA